MMELLSIMAAPFAACLILTGIHAYLGIHILARGVIFVDLALAQIAALGALTAALLHVESKLGIYLFSLGLTIVGAGVFTYTRSIKGSVPQEAFIGMAYAVASAGYVLMADRVAHPSDEIKSMLTGSILFVSWKEIGGVAALYAAVGLIYWIFRKPFMLISLRPKEAQESGISIRWWDFLFYALFGVVVTSSVQIAGILLVFSFLIAPAIVGSLFSSRMGVRLMIGWIFGFAVSFNGCLISYQMDDPTGPTVVCMFGLGLVAALLARRALRRYRATEDSS